MNTHKAAARRRARLRELLRSNTQAAPRRRLEEIRELLGESVSLRTIKRDLRAVRGRVPKGTQSKSSKSLNHRETSYTVATMKDLAKRVAVLESINARLISAMERLADAQGTHTSNIAALVRENDYLRTVLERQGIHTLLPAANLRRRDERPH